MHKFARKFEKKFQNPGIHISRIINFVKNYRCIVYKTNLTSYSLFKRICVHILYKFSDNGIIIAAQKRCYARDP